MKLPTPSQTLLSNVPMKHSQEIATEHFSADDPIQASHPEETIGKTVQPEEIIAAAQQDGDDLGGDDPEPDAECPIEEDAEQLSAALDAQDVTLEREEEQPVLEQEEEIEDEPEWMLAAKTWVATRKSVEGDEPWKA